MLNTEVLKTQDIGSLFATLSIIKAAMEQSDTDKEFREEAIMAIVNELKTRDVSDIIDVATDAMMTSLELLQEQNS